MMNLLKTTNWNVAMTCASLLVCSILSFLAGLYFADNVLHLESTLLCLLSGFLFGQSVLVFTSHVNNHDYDDDFRYMF